MHWRRATASAVGSYQRKPVVITLVIFFSATIWLMLVAIKCQVSGSRKGERQRRGITYPQVTL